MKIAITGHTSGIGEGLYNKLLELGHRVDGFSRSNGYDISKEHELHQLVWDIKDYDLFINNAFSWWAQTELLRNVFYKWQYTNKTIINISSNSANGTKDSIHKYAIVKHSLDEMSEKLRVVDNACNIVNIRPGFVDTPMVAHIDYKKLSVEDIVNIVVWTINQPKHICINEIEVNVR